MDKLGWQVITGVAVSLCVMASAAAWNTSRALDNANHELRESSRCPPPSVAVVVPTPAVYVGAPEKADMLITADARCINGQLFRKAASEWVQLGSC